MVVEHRVGPQTSRLLHRELVVDDAMALFALNSDPEIMRYTGETPLASAADAERAIIDYPDFNRIGYGRWASVLKETQSVIGFCGLKYLEDLDEVDIGYRFLPSYWGMGLATEAANACLDYGFDVIGLSRIVAFVMPENAASIRVVEKTGMVFESTFDYDGIPTFRYAKERSKLDTARERT